MASASESLLKNWTLAGNIDYCFHPLLEKRWIRNENFDRANTLRYAYLLTPENILKKPMLTAEFLKPEAAEYESLQREIEQLKTETAHD